MAKMNYITDTNRVSTIALYSGDYIAHHGIKGQKWGVRRYQNEDGTLTAAGRRRYNVDKAEAIQRDIDSFKGYENGIRSKSGKLLLSAQDVKDSVRALEKKRDSVEKKGDERKAKDIEKARKKYDKNLEKNWYKAHNEATKFLNGPDGYAALNKKWSDLEMSKYSDWSKSPRYQEYLEEADAMYREAYNREVENLFGKRP